MAHSSSDNNGMALTIARSEMEWRPATEHEDDGEDLVISEPPQWLVDLWAYITRTREAYGQFADQCRNANVSVVDQYGNLADKVEFIKEGCTNLFHHLQKGQEEIKNLHAYNFRSLHKDCTELGSQVYTAMSQLTENLARKEEAIAKANAWMAQGFATFDMFYTDVSRWAAEKNAEMSELQPRVNQLEQELERMKMDQKEFRSVDLTEAILKSYQQRKAQGLSTNPREVLVAVLDSGQNQPADQTPKVIHQGDKMDGLTDEHYQAANQNHTIAQRWAEREAQFTPLPPERPPRPSNNHKHQDSDVQMIDADAPPKPNRTVQWVFGGAPGGNSQQQHVPAFMHGAAGNSPAPGGGAAGHHEPPTGGGGGKGGGNAPPDDDPDDSSSDSGSHDASGDDFLRRLRRFSRHEDKRKQERRRRRRLLSRSASPAPATVTQLVSKKPKMVAPKAYGGDRKEDFRVWLHQVEDYMEYCSEEFTTDSVKILWLSGLLKDKALTWYQARRLAFKKNNDDDSWATFRKALCKRFKDSFEADKADEQMQQERYNGDISDYLAKMRTHNLKVGLAHVAWRRRLKAGLPEDIVQRVSQYPDPPEDDEDFEQRLEVSGKNYEDFKQESKFRGNTHEQGAVSKRSKKTNGSGVGRSSGPSATLGGSKPRDGPKKPSFQKGKIIYTDVSQATQGVPLPLVESRKRQNQCLRCGMSGHRWKFCFKPANPNPNPNGYKAAGVKRGREESDFAFKQLTAGNVPKRLKPSAALITAEELPPENSVSVISAAQTRRFYERSDGEESDFY